MTESERITQLEGSIVFLLNEIQEMKKKWEAFEKSKIVKRTQTKELTQTGKEVAVKEVSPVSQFVGVYVKAFQKRYGENTRPELHDKKIQGQIKLFVLSHPIERACQLIETYLQMDDTWFKTKTHDFITFKENLQKIGLALDTGESRPGVAVGIAEILKRREDETRGI